MAVLNVYKCTFFVIYKKSLFYVSLGLLRNTLSNALFLASLERRAEWLF